MSWGLNLGSNRKTGTAATRDDAFFASAAQGALADTAVQPDELESAISPIQDDIGNIEAALVAINGEPA